MNTRFDRGMETLRKLSGGQGTDPLDSIKRFSPDFYHMIIEFGFGDVYSRTQLDLKQRNLLTLSSLITQGAEGQLPFHLNAALNVGLTPEEIVEVIMHCTAYAGFPKGCGALAVAMKFFQERNISLTKEYALR
ncbi:carboxymuconolactone decarboxylase family protein [Paenibacillus sp. YYML68]|uniref:carboxymuconolactone decarboxylase family protein n=1 Tax=Paenibacillus sp. YYML68 TaxID=2909250 RepID=UPI0024921287|nr:carboxymuconolactone decarboxylase family protein [Paenibacillus sp. YYML68]